MSLAQCFWLFIQKYFFWPIWNIAFCKNIFIFRYSYIITNFKFRNLLIIFFISKSILVHYFTSAGFILMVLWYALLYLLTKSSNLSIYKFFWYWSHVFINFILQGSNNSLANNRFSLVMYWIYFYGNFS